MINLSDEKNKVSGSSIIEYIIPLTLIGVVVGLGLFYMFSSGNFDSFFRSSMNAEINNDSYVLDKNVESSGPLVAEKNKITPGSLGGSISDPKTRCEGGNCNIDFGNYVLQGIPSEFNDFVESSATSGGTDKLASLLMQIANNENIDMPTRNLIKELANKGHRLATIENSIELLSRTCTVANCQIQSTAESQAKTLSALNMDFDNSLSQINSTMNSSSNPIDAEALEAVNALSNEIMKLAENMSKITKQAARIDNGTMGIRIRQHINSNADDITDQDSAKICEEGDGQDSGKNCN